MSNGIKDIMDIPEDSNAIKLAISGTPGSLDSFTATTLNAMNVSKSEYPQVEVKKRVNDFNADVIYDYVQKFGITDVNLSNLQKLHERELINVPFFQKFRRILGSQMVKSHLMDALGISKSYTGFHEYIKYEREDIPNAGLCNIAKKVNYNVMIIPIPEDITDAEYKRLCSYRDGFIQAVDKMIKESNVPVTRAKPTAKNKQRFVNTELIDGLALDNEKIMSSITGGISTIENEDKIGADEIFQDTSGPFEPEVHLQHVQQMNDDEVMNFGLDTNNGSFSIGEIGNMSGLNSFDDIFGSLEEPLVTVVQPLINNNIIDTTTSVDMSGYEDTFEDFKKIEEDALNKVFFEDDDSSDSSSTQITK